MLGKVSGDRHTGVARFRKLPFRTRCAGERRPQRGDANLIRTSLEEKVSESVVSDDPGAQKRRSTRIAHAVPITVTGVDALGQPFKERTTTVMVNCHGCKYQSKHYVPKDSNVKLEIPRPEG